MNSRFIIVKVNFADNYLFFLDYICRTVADVNNVKHASFGMLLLIIITIFGAMVCLKRDLCECCSPKDGKINYTPVSSGCDLGLQYTSNCFLLPRKL